MTSSTLDVDVLADAVAGEESALAVLAAAEPERVCEVLGAVRVANESVRWWSMRSAPVLLDERTAVVATRVVLRSTSWTDRVRGMGLVSALAGSDAVLGRVEAELVVSGAYADPHLTEVLAAAYT